MEIAAPTLANNTIARRSRSSTARIQSSETSAPLAGIWSPDGCCGRARADGCVMVLQLPHLDRGAQRGVHLELNLARVANRGHQDRIRLQRIDRAWGLHHEPRLA